MGQIIRKGVVPVCGGPIKLMGAKLGDGAPDRPGYTGARFKFVPESIGDPNFGFNKDSGQGLLDPGTIDGLEAKYLASFGVNFFNLRVGPAGQSQIATSDHVILNTPQINLWKAVRFDWSGINLRYQGVSDQLAEKLELVAGESIVTDIYWIA